MPDDTDIPVLLVHAGPGAGRVLPLNGERMVLGRDPASALPFDSAGVSREHCAFIKDEAGCWNILDLGARNGTRLNDRPLKEEQVILTEGDRIIAGTVELEYGLDRGGADRLRVVKGPLAGRALPLRSAVAILGRAEPDADISLNDQAASRHNTELRFENGIWTVTDLDSRNGTDYDGARIPAHTPLPLHSGARIRAGATTFDFLDRRVEDLANRTLLGYHLEERAAAGPGAVIYRGRGDDGTPVAMKIMDPNRIGDTSAVARFIASGTAQGRLEDSHILPTLAAECVDDITVVISSWCKLGCLATRLTGGKPIPVDTLLNWCADIAAGMVALEAANTAHRGFRPANFVVNDDGMVQLTDVLTATPFNHQQPHGPVPPHYVSPEEATGNDPTLTGNQFSFGCFIHHALSARAPFGAPDRQRVAQARVDESLVAIEGLPPDWHKVLARLLAREPSDRYPSWTAIADDIGALRRGVQPATGLLPAGRSALASAGTSSHSPAPARASTRAARESSRLGTRVLPETRSIAAEERVTIPGWAIKGAIIFIILLLFIGFGLPIINRSNRANDAEPTQAAPSRAPSSPTADATPRTTAPAPIQAPSAEPTPLAPPISEPTSLPEPEPAPAPAPAPAPERPQLITPEPTATTTPIINEPAPTPQEPASVVPATMPVLVSAPRTTPSELFSSEHPPALKPAFVVVGRVGGPGNQYMRSVGCDSVTAWGSGDGFAVSVDLATRVATVTGTPNDDQQPWSIKFPRHPNEVVTLNDERTGQTYSITTKQVHPILQQPLLTSTAGWKMWGWSYDDVTTQTKAVRWGPLMADSRGYDVWLMPRNQIGVLCWTDGGNSVLTRDPQDLNKGNEATENGQSELSSPGGMATLFMVIDPETGRPVSGTFVRSHVTNRAVDRFGRVYLPTHSAGTPLKPSPADAGAGLYVLDQHLQKSLANLRIGGGTANGEEAFSVLAIHDRWLVLGGTTAAALPALGGGAKRADGDLQDAFICVLQLW